MDLSVQTRILIKFHYLIALADTRLSTLQSGNLERIFCSNTLY